MTTTETLRQELINDPIGIGYDSMSDAEAAEALNTKTRPGKRAVQATEVRSYVLLSGLWARISNVAQSSPDPIHQGTAVTILQTLAPNSFETIRMQDSSVYGAVTQMLQTMVSAGAMEQEHMDAMLAMGDALVGRGEEIGIGSVSHIDVAEARTPL
jgi:hypothetical protein